MIGFYNYTVVPTYIGLASAILGIFFAMQGKPTWAIYCLMLSGLCDMFDGKIARTRKRTEEEKSFGIQIDSLCDLVCFGVLPIVIGYSLGMNRLWQTAVMLLYVLGALIRLGYFNVMEARRQSQTTEVRTAYEGLPVTSVALILPFVYSFRQVIGVSFPMIYAGALLLISVLFVLPFKVKKPGIKGLILLGILGLAEIIFVIYMAGK